MNWLWKHFPFLYVLPFLLATSRFEQASGPSELLRWLVLAAGCGFAMYAGWSRAGRSPGKLSSADGWMLAFLGLFLVSTAWSISQTYTAMRAISLVMLYICSMWTLWSYVDRFSEARLVSRVLNILAVALAINLVIGGLLFPGELLGRRFQGLFMNPNNIGILVGVALPLAIGRWLRSRTGWDLAVVAVLGANLAACGTRSALLGVLVACAAFFVPLAARRPTWAWTLVAVALAGGGIVSQTEFFKERILREETLESGSTRTGFWELGKEYTAERPWAGHGFATDGLIHEYYGRSLFQMQLRGYGVMSSYYGMTVQLGRPLAYAFFGLLWGFAIWCLIVWRRDFQLVIYGGTIASGLIVCIFESAIYSAGNCFSFLFWMVVALAVRRMHYHRERVPMDVWGGLARQAVGGGRNRMRGVRRGRRRNAG